MLYLISGLIILIGILYCSKIFKKTELSFNLPHFKIAFIFLLFIFFASLLIRGHYLILLFIPLVTGAFFIFKYLVFGIEKNKKSTRSPDFSMMTRKEALEILGLQEGADKETIQRSHRDLLKKLHPDCGGTNYLTAMINDAKNILLPD